MKFMLSVVSKLLMLSVINLNVIMLNVVVPSGQCYKTFFGIIYAADSDIVTSKKVL